MKEDNSDETMLWNSIVEKIRRAAAANKRYEELSPRFDDAEMKLAVNSDSTSALLSRGPFIVLMSQLHLPNAN